MVHSLCPYAASRNNPGLLVCRFFIAFSFFMVATRAEAGAWLQEKGHGLRIDQVTYYRADNYFDATGQSQPQPTFSKYEFQPYLEYGLLENLTIGGSAFVQQVTQSGVSNHGIADPEIFARFTLWSNDRHTISVQPLLKLTSSFHADDMPRGGSQGTDMELSLLYGRNMTLWSDHDYMDMRVGYRQRGNGLSPQLRIDSTTGIKLTETIEVTSALRATLPTTVSEQTSFHENGDRDYSLIKTELAGIYHFNEQQWLQASLSKHLSGAQTGGGYGLSISFAQRF